MTADSHAVAAELRAAWGVRATRGVARASTAPRGAARDRRAAGRYLLFVGALEPRKAPEVLAAAHAARPRARPRRRARRRRRRRCRPASTTPSWPRSTRARWPSWCRRASRASGCRRSRPPPTARPPSSPTCRASPRRWATPRCACRSATRARWPTRCCASRGDDALRARLGAAARERAALYTWERAARRAAPAAGARRRRELHDRHRAARLGRRARAAAAPRCASTCPPTPQLVVVDSGSSDDGPALARAAGAEVIVLDGNPGFGAANNAGVARGAPRRHRPAQPRLRAARRRAVRAGARARRARGAARPAPAQRRRRAAAQRAPAAGHARPRSCAPRCPRARCPSPTAPRRPRRVGWAIAACLAAPTALLRRLGPFDPGAFLFYEDMDLCLRARAAGRADRPASRGRGRHLGGRSTARAFGGEAFDLQARRRREVVGARLGARALRLRRRRAGLDLRPARRRGTRAGPQRGGPARAARRTADGHRRTALAQPDYLTTAFPSGGPSGRRRRRRSATSRRALWARSGRRSGLAAVERAEQVGGDERRQRRRPSLAAQDVDAERERDHPTAGR